MITLKPNTVITIAAESPQYDRLRRTLDSLPKDEIYTSEEILSKSGVGMDTLWRHKGKLSAYRYKAPKVIYWGHPKAIEEFKRRLANL